MDIKNKQMILQLSVKLRDLASWLKTQTKRLPEMTANEYTHFLEVMENVERLTGELQPLKKIKTVDPKETLPS